MAKKGKGQKGKVSRRDFAKLSAGAVASGIAGVGASALGGASPAHAASISKAIGRKASLSQTKGQRTVVVGGGWSGLTIAKYLKRHVPEMDVVLIERRSTFMSCPISNLWLGGLVGLEFIVHSFLDAAKSNNYTFFNATVIDLDREEQKVFTEQGYVEYDFLVLAPGIAYDYGAIGVEDAGEVSYLKKAFPAGFVPGSEHLTIKRKIEEFKNGDFLLTVPEGNYRCLPAPYERACMIASFLKTRKIFGRVILIDPRDKPSIKADGFLTAFDELYRGYLDYRPSTVIKGVDGRNKKILTEFDEIPFDDAAIYPKIRASEMIESFGLMDPESLQKEAKIDVFKYNVDGDKGIYVTGDSRPMPFSKSGNTARSEGAFVAKVIAARSAGKEIEWESPHTICYSMVNAAPSEAIMIDTFYKHDGEQFQFDETQLFEGRSAEMGEAVIEWGAAHFRDMFS
jgi:sulfide dehydrogenase [flavocytochrome c] flavoprotein chain